MRIEKDIPLDRAALLGCTVLAGMGAALNTAKVKPGSSVAVFGCGGVGASIIQGARLAGARQIIAVDIVPAKLEAARRFGATRTILSAADEPVGALIDLTGEGVDYAFDAVGHVDLLSQCFASLPPRGLAVLVGAVRAG